MSENRISAVSALTLLRPAYKSGARTRICERAFAGLVRAKAKQFDFGGRVSRDAEIPRIFWWAKGEAALERDWVAGDFSTWVDHKVEMKAFGVQFASADIEELLPVLDRKVPENKSLTQDDIEIVARLEALLPAAARSYKQSALDMFDEGRISFRGTAAELRETLREVLDYLAPDIEVERQPGYSPEPGQTKPIMKQKVRFIMKAKGRKSSTDVPEGAIVAFEEAVSILTRSVYNNSSAVVHTAGDRERVLQLKRYAVAVFHEILAT